MRRGKELLLSFKHASFRMSPQLQETEKKKMYIYIYTRVEAIASRVEIGRRNIQTPKAPAVPPPLALSVVTPVSSLGCSWCAIASGGGSSTWLPFSGHGSNIGKRHLSMAHGFNELIS